uniref:hypothetical protein n=1 Tax=Ruminococcus sp. TaxID=41978 RepID=UPI004029571B
MLTTPITAASAIPIILFFIVFPPKNDIKKVRSQEPRTEKMHNSGCCDTTRHFKKKHTKIEYALLPKLIKVYTFT